MMRGTRMQLDSWDWLPVDRFGDGPPRWTIGAGKSWQRPSQTQVEATAQRDNVVRKLEWHCRDQRVTDYGRLARLLSSCSSTSRCHSGACPICIRALQRHFVVEGVRFASWVAAAPRQGATIRSLVPDFGAALPGRLDRFDWGEFVRRSRRALGQCGIKKYLLSADVSLNHWEQRQDESVFQVQLWGQLEEPSWAWRERLKDKINSRGAITNPVFEFEPRSLEASLAYGVKNKFTRRVSFMRAYPERLGRKASRDTISRELRGARWAELMLFLNDIGLGGRIVAQGVDLGVRRAIES
jgi:hypothetical protein